MDILSLGKVGLYNIKDLSLHIKNKLFVILIELSKTIQWELTLANTSIKTCNATRSGNLGGCKL